ncbi:hypothetical protein C4D60_Mb07t28340 [Musa balbisiana]|uniref:Prephenate dehydratase domain-containing protein n=1 Tax=Musa balbisiana TaxID=52838 RepID=A0A4S8JIW1_MUSBA|nr:hypothetical protein C4D60_Mb07t28340 [Musa balbisiana]
MLCSGLRGFQVERAGLGFHVPGAGVGWSCRLPPPPHVPSRALPAPDWRRERVRGGRLGSVVVRVKPVEDENLSPAAPLQLSADRAVKESRKWGRNSSSLPEPLSLTDLSVSEHGSKVRVAYQGSPGAFSEAAVLKAYPQGEAVPCEQFEVALKEVVLSLVNKAVLPIENSMVGSYHQNYDLLLCHNLHIVGEVQLSINHRLVALPGVHKEQLRHVLSHPQALGQCEIALSKLDVVRESVDDSAGATQGLRDAGAIASARAADIYGHNVLEETMQAMNFLLSLLDVPKNVLRFLVLAREPIIPRIDRAFKTSIVFTLEEGPEVLFKALGVLSLGKIKLTKIKKRPQRSHPLFFILLMTRAAKYFDYLFFIDFEASMAARNALSNLQEFATFLGSYPMDTTL